MKIKFWYSINKTAVTTNAHKMRYTRTSHLELFNCQNTAKSLRIKLAGPQDKR
jgi:hypothetical protein